MQSLPAFYIPVKCIMNLFGEYESCCFLSCRSQVTWEKLRIRFISTHQILLLLWIADACSRS